VNVRNFYMKSFGMAPSMSQSKTIITFRTALICVFAAILGSGCALVPGTYLGVSAPVNETDKEYEYDTPSTQDVSERADIFSITPAVIAKQNESRARVELKMREQREKSVGEGTGYEYIIGAQDVLNVTVWNHPEINNPAGTMNATLAGRTVNQDGTFFFPYAGKVAAAGRTVQQVRDELAIKLARVLVEPQVDVSVLHYRSKRAFVVGMVEKPGVVPLTDVPLTITDLVAEAGGVKPEADLRSASLMSKGKSRGIDLYALYYQGDVSQNVWLQPGDILTIPENRYNKIFVLGEVTKPQSLIMPRGRISLAEALSDAGGFNPLTSNAGQMYVIRNGENNRPQIWHLDAASPDALVLADRFDLEPRDIVYVDPAGVARFGRVINNIIPTASVLRATAQNW